MMTAAPSGNRCSIGLFTLSPWCPRLDTTLLDGNKIPAYPVFPLFPLFSRTFPGFLHQANPLVIETPMAETLPAMKQPGYFTAQYCCTTNKATWHKNLFSIPWIDFHDIVNNKKHGNKTKHQDIVTSV